MTDDCSGAIVAEWLDDGRAMRLIQDFAYTDPSGVVWSAPKGSVIDGASIPRFLWSLIGGPFEGRYRKASVVHDVACVEKSRPWQDVHQMFRTAMLCGGVDPSQARMLFAAVYHYGPRWETLGPAARATVTMMPAIDLPRNDFARLDQHLTERFGRDYGLPARTEAPSEAP